MQNYYRYNGFLNINKEAGWTSMDVCARLKSLLHVKKVGHAGTLDPMAEGVLPVALGRATKSISLIADGTKEYTAVMLLGLTTDTEDITGTVTGRWEGELPGEALIRQAAEAFTGKYLQKTPMYSARKVGGRRLYDYARAGIEVERGEKEVQIDSISVDRIELPRVVMTVVCSKGTYIRSLCRDIGERLGCGACMEKLTRNRVGDYLLEDALRIPEVEAYEARGSLDELLRVEAPTAVSIGKFDGAHIGHQALIRELRKVAQERRLKTLVLILRFGRSGVLPDEERKRRLYEAGIDYCVELAFTEELKEMSAEDFLEKILIGRFHMQAIVAGKDVSFGRGKAGNADFLYENADKYGFYVHLIDKIALPQIEAGAKTEISSTALRGSLKAGEMEETARLLGEPYAITGRVVHGKGIAGPQMQYPTMNIEVPDTLTLPPFGAYAVRASIGDGPFLPGIANLGERPTVGGSVEGGSPVRLEVHVFGEPGECYGAEVRTELIRFLRPEKKFADLAELKEQIFAEDVPAARRALGLEREQAAE